MRQCWRRRVGRMIRCLMGNKRRSSQRGWRSHHRNHLRSQLQCQTNISLFLMKSSCNWLCNNPKEVTRSKLRSENSKCHRSNRSYKNHRSYRSHRNYKRSNKNNNKQRNNNKPRNSLPLNHQKKPKTSSSNNSLSNSSWEWRRNYRKWKNRKSSKNKKQLWRHKSNNCHQKGKSHKWRT